MRTVITSHTAVVAAIRSGQRGATVARRFGVSRERIRQIYKRETGERLPILGQRCPLCRARYTDRSGHAETPAHAAAIEQRRLERFWAQVEKTDTCWLWRAGTSAAGYGHAQRDGEGYAHRVSYILENGPIPDGLTIDHLCRVRHCVKPSHLEAVSIRVNILRGNGMGARNARKTHCVHGHELPPKVDGQNRPCRPCHNRSTRERYQRRLLARLAVA